MQVDVTYDDPGTFDSPLQVVVNLEYAADDEMLELVCNEASGGRREALGRRQDCRRSRNCGRSRSGILGRYIGRYEGIWLNNPTRVEVTLENGALLLQSEWR